MKTVFENYQDILEDLCSRYYTNFLEHSEVTSSYWRSVGSQKIEKNNNLWLAEGFGFGNFRHVNFLSKIKFLPQRVLLVSLMKKYNCYQGLIDAGEEIAKKSGRILDFDCVKQILSLDVILKLLNNGLSLTRQGVKVLCVVGDGYGFFSSLVKLVDPKIKVISINLGRTLFFDVLFSQKCFPTYSSVLLTKESKEQEMFSAHSLIFVEAENFNLLEGLPINLFINIASMQEMEPFVIQKYFEYMRSSSQSPCYFYCCNRLEKKLPDEKIIKFKEYPWEDSDILLDELCPWYQKFPISKPPFWSFLDGPVQHRFVNLK